MQEMFDAYLGGMRWITITFMPLVGVSVTVRTFLAMVKISTTINND